MKGGWMIKQVHEQTQFFLDYNKINGGTIDEDADDDGY
jgi:hypothetical protein